VSDHTAEAAPRTKSGLGALWWTSATIVVAGALVLGTAGLLSTFAPGAMLALLGRAGEQPSPGTRVFADYTGTRDVAIAVALLVAAVLLSRRSVIGLPPRSPRDEGRDSPVAAASHASAVDGDAVLLGTSATFTNLGPPLGRP
jgi:hypothetical protein